MKFLKSSELELNAAGYLVSKTSNKPVNHAAFVQQQRNAEYIVKLAEAIKDKTFKAGKVDNLEEIKASVRASIDNKNVKEYVAAPTKPTSKVNDELVQFALDFVNFDSKKLEVEKINKLMAEFDAIDGVETVGDYFSEGLVKLNSIYSIETILAAVKINADKLK